MQVHIHDSKNDRKIAVSFPTPRHRAFRASPAVAPQPIRSQAQALATQTAPAFSPLVQEFLDECGYSDK